VLERIVAAGSAVLRALLVAPRSDRVSKIQMAVVDSEVPLRGLEGSLLLLLQQKPWAREFLCFCLATALWGRRKQQTGGYLFLLKEVYIVFQRKVFCAPT